MFLSICKLIITICLIFDLRLLVNELIDRNKTRSRKVKLSNGQHIDHYVDPSVFNK